MAEDQDVRLNLDDVEQPITVGDEEVEEEEETDESANEAEQPVEKKRGAKKEDSQPCEACGGSGFKEEEVVCPECEGTGKII